MVPAFLLPVLALAGVDTPTLFAERFYAPTGQASRFDSLNEIQAVDMDGDGAPDIVGTFRAAPIVGSPPDGVFVQRGLGGNEFDPVDAESVVGTPQGFRVARLDRDDRPDLVVVHSSPSGFTIYRGTGGGHLAPGVTTTINASSVRLVDASDMDLDGIVDIVLTTSVDTRVMLGLGDGTFGAPITLLPFALSRARVADVDGRNGLDLIGLGGAALAMATPLAFQNPISLPLNGQLSSFLFEIGDATGDGILDVLVTYDTQFSPDILQVLAGNGDGTFVEILQDDQAKLDFIIDMHVGDVDADGLKDVVLFAAEFVGLPTIVVYPNLGGSLGPEVLYDEIPYLNAFDLADFDGDGRDDLAIGLLDSPRTGALLAGPNADFERPTLFDFGNRRVVQAELAPFDSSPFDDLLFISDQPSDRLIALSGSGDGDFSQSGSIKIADTPRALALGDIDQDGNIDTVTLGETPATDNLLVHRGVGDGTFQKIATLPGGLQVRGLALGDLDSNGVLDIATVSNPGTFAIHPGLPGGTFAPPVLTAYSPGLMRIAIGDLDADGRDDALLLDGSLDELLVRYQDTSGALERALRIPTLETLCCSAFEQTGLAIGHWNEDPYLDIAVGSRFGLSLHFSNGARSYDAPRYLRGVPFVGDPAQADLNGDGHEDLVLLSDTIVVLFGDGRGAFPEIHHYLSPTSANGLAIGNVDGVGGPDIVVGTRSIISGFPQPRGAVLLNQR